MHTWSHSCFYLFLLIISTCANLSAQNYHSQHLTVKDGLPNSGILSIYKDTGGLLWIGTKGPLCHYDGKTFQVYKTPDGKMLSQIGSITEDKNGHLWLGSRTDGIFQITGDSIRNFTSTEGLSDNLIREVFYSENFDVIVASSLGGINVIREDTIFTSPAWMGSVDTTLTFLSMAENRDFIYCTCIDNIGPVHYYPKQNIFLPSHQNGALDLFITSSGDTVITKYPMGVEIYAQNETLIKPEIGQVFQIDEDSQGNLWMAAWSYNNRDFGGGIYRYDGRAFANFQKDFGINDREIWSVCCDNEQDILWVGTLNDGLYKITLTHFENFSPDYFEQDQWSVNSLFVDRTNTLWIAEDQSLIRMYPDGKYNALNKSQMMLAFQDYWKTMNRVVYAKIDSVQESLRTLNQARFNTFIEQFPFNFQYLQADAQGTVYYSNRFGLFSFHQGKTDYFGSEGSEGFFDWLSQDTLIFCGTGSSLILTGLSTKRANLTQDRTAAWPIHFRPPNAIRFNGDEDEKDYPHSINRLIRHHNQVWYASRKDGLWMSQGLNLINYNQSHPWIHNNLTDICFDQNGRIIFSSNDGLIWIAEQRDSGLELKYQIDDSCGIIGHTIDWMVVDDNRHLWFGTNLGLNVLDLKELDESNHCEISFYDQNEGYLGQGSSSAVIDQNGFLYIAGDENLIKLDTKDWHNKLRPSKQNHIVVRSFLVNDKLVGQESKAKMNGITDLPDDFIRLKHFENNLVISYDVLNYINPEKDLFRYRLEGYDTEWHDWSHTRTATYTNLKPGKYYFKVESVNQSENQSAAPLTVSLIIPKPLWKLWYLQFVSYCILAAFLFWLSKNYFDQKRRKQLRQSELESKILQLEMSALQAQMNPHFIFNSLTSIQGYILENKTNEVMNYLADFSKVIRSSLVYAKQTAMPLDKEVEFLHAYLRLEKMRFEDKFDFEIKVLNVSNTYSTRIPSMMIQPFAENSVKHGFSRIHHKGSLIITFDQLNGETVLCTIQDNGSGQIEDLENSAIDKKSDRLHSTTIADRRIAYYNDRRNTNTYKITYQNLMHEGEIVGSKVEVYLPIL